MRISGAIGVMAVLAACDGPFPSPLMGQGEPLEMRLLQCKNQLGLPGQLKTSVRMTDNQVIAVAVPHDQIDAAEAARINDCAGGATTTEDGMVVVPLAVAPAPTATVRVPVPVAIAPRRAAVPRSVNGCPPGVRGLYRGTLICTGVQ